ncbi:hypothetical protein [Desulfosarcina sp.]|uniref:hypothetical protein n=1 Tax=Desulfosarcina sp. TaxID=2027861 RepID=UPI003565858F
MDSPLLIAAGASFIAGLLGYIIARLWIKPIVRYNLTKRKLDRELTRYLVQMNASTGPEEPVGHHRDTMLRAARQHAVDLVACFHEEIPYWYRLLLESRKESPTEASGLLTNLSKIRNSEQVMRRIERARTKMGINGKEKT